jgi:hypothetical protein
VAFPDSPERGFQGPSYNVAININGRGRKLDISCRGCWLRFPAAHLVRRKFSQASPTSRTSASFRRRLYGFSNHPGLITGLVSLVVPLSSRCALGGPNARWPCQNIPFKHGSPRGGFIGKISASSSSAVFLERSVVIKTRLFTSFYINQFLELRGSAKNPKI